MNPLVVSVPASEASVSVPAWCENRQMNTLIHSGGGPMMGRPQADTDARTGASDGRRALAEAAPERAAEVLRLAENAVLEARIYPIG